MTCNDHIITANANKIHKTIKDFKRIFPEEFIKTDIKSCGHCNATGLKDKHQMYFCDNCGGTGFVGYEKIEKSYTCRHCNGSGCDVCNYNGMVDWIIHANGRDIRKVP